MAANDPLITGTDFICIPTQDFERARRFYGETLGLPELKTWGDMPAVEFETGNLTIAVMQSDAFGVEFAPHSHPVAFQVDDVPAAKERLAAQPLEYDVVYKPAARGQRLDVVLGQIPAKGTLSAYDEVILVLAKPRYGVVPSVVGLPVERAIRRLERLKLQPAVVGGPAGHVIRQTPRGRIAAAPGMSIRLVVSRG